MGAALVERIDDRVQLTMAVAAEDVTIRRGQELLVLVAPSAEGWPVAPQNSSALLDEPWPGALARSVAEMTSSGRDYGLSATPNIPFLPAFGAMNHFSTQRDATKSSKAELPSTSSDIKSDPECMNGQAFSNSYFIV